MSIIAVRLSHAGGLAKVAVADAGGRPRRNGTGLPGTPWTDSAGLRYTTSMAYNDRITIEPGKRGGKPCIRGMRMTVYDVLEYLASGMTQEEILADFPDLEAADIRACLLFAADRERKMVTITLE